MNLFCRQAVILLLFYWYSGASVEAQAEFNVKAGLETWSLKDENDQFGRSSHSGQMIGFDVFIQRKKLLFVPGFHYHRISVLNEDETFNFSFSKSHHFHYFTIPLTFGYKVLDQSAIDISLLAGGEVHFYYDIDDNNVGLDNDMLYGVFTALTGIFHVEFLSILTTEAKYHYALQPIINFRDDSKLRGWTFALGVKF